jgi:hypothetical protein
MVGAEMADGSRELALRVGVVGNNVGGLEDLERGDVGSISFAFISHDGFSASTIGDAGRIGWLHVWDDMWESDSIWWRARASVDDGDARAPEVDMESLLTTDDDENDNGAMEPSIIVIINNFLYGVIRWDDGGWEEGEIEKVHSRMPQIKGTQRRRKMRRPWTDLRTDSVQWVVVVDKGDW